MVGDLPTFIAGFVLVRLLVFIALTGISQGRALRDDHPVHGPHP